MVEVLVEVFARASAGEECIVEVGGMLEFNDGEDEPEEP